ncbi:hypothetical protein ACSNN9_28435 [Micromonospora sp. URMC 107]|uniref:hypothetical protein n=1 Tax=Micromonospora sp. URMC 107 TaxID=3423418 RepID=UPI003F1A0169
MSVETWSRMPSILPDQRPFDFAFEGSVDFPDDCWLIDKSVDDPIVHGIELPSGAGPYGARVIAYHHNEILDRFELAQAQTSEESPGSGQAAKSVAIVEMMWAGRRYRSRSVK